MKSIFTQRALEVYRITRAVSAAAITHLVYSDYCLSRPLGNFGLWSDTIAFPRSTLTLFGLSFEHICANYTMFAFARVKRRVAPSLTYIFLLLHLRAEVERGSPWSYISSQRHPLTDEGSSTL